MKKASKNKKHPGGAPTKYKEAYNKQAYIACSRGGFSDKDLAELFSVQRSTINYWKGRYPEFLDSIKRGKDNYDTALVEGSLLQSALGYEHEDVHISNYQGEITATPLTKHYPPNPTTLIFWLKNRNPARWRDIKAIEHTGKDGERIKIDLTDEERSLFNKIATKLLEDAA